MALGISENRIGKAERFDRCAYLIYLALGMGARIARIGNEFAHRAVGDGQPRRFYRRYFVHTGTSPTIGNGRTGGASTQGNSSAAATEYRGTSAQSQRRACASSA